MNNQMPVDDNGGLQDVPPVALEEIPKGGQQGQPDVPPAAQEEIPKRAQEVTDNRKRSGHQVEDL